jgi:Nif-specific regulatory protein
MSDLALDPTNKYSRAMPTQNEEVRKLASLLEMSQSLSGAHKLKDSLHRVLELLERHHNVVRGVVLLADVADGTLRVEAAIEAGRTTPKSRAKFDGAIVERVVGSNKPVVVPEMSFELAGAGRRVSPARELTLVCVPVLLGRKSIGALVVELAYKADRDYDRATKFFTLVASIIAQAVKVDRLVEADRRRLLEENRHLREELRERYDFSHIVGNSGPMRLVYEQVAQVAPTNTTVLIRGESGTGKELIAHAIHYNSPRSKKPFVKVNCAALPETLIESELFGYERGAFTGAVARKKGRFEMAEGGTLFLDEIGDLNPAIQVKLLRVLQEREFERLGGTETIKTNVRLIAATNSDLEQGISDGTFRGDLYYRLNVFTIYVPSLRERKSDTLLLADHFLQKFATEHGKDIKRISTPAIDMLMSYHWPGNVRELENTIERSVLVCAGDVVHGHHLPPTLQTAESSNTMTRVSLAEAVEAFEKDLIQDTLKTTAGNRARAARLLDTTERIINYKIQKYRIDPRRFRG